MCFSAGWLGHYVADGSQPLHTTIQYNGWTGPNPNGYTTEHKIHSQFESAFVIAANAKTADVAPLVAAAKPMVLNDDVGGLPGVSAALELACGEDVSAGEGGWV